MTAKAALIKAFLEGKTINIKNCLMTVGLSNCSREVIRCVEEPFGIVITRIKREGFSRYKQPANWLDYKLERSRNSPEAIQKLIEYVLEQEGSPKTDKQEREQRLLKSGITRAKQNPKYSQES